VYVEISIESREIRLYDSLKKKAVRNWLSTLQEDLIIHGKSNEKIVWKLVQLDGPQQKDTTSCGFFSLLFHLVRNCSQKEFRDWQTKSADYWRLYFLSVVSDILVEANK